MNSIKKIIFTCNHIFNETLTRSIVSTLSKGTFATALPTIPLISLHNKPISSRNIWDENVLANINNHSTLSTVINLSSTSKFFYSFYSESLKKLQDSPWILAAPKLARLDPLFASFQNSTFDFIRPNTFINLLHHRTYSHPFNQIREFPIKNLSNKNIKSLLNNPTTVTELAHIQAIKTNSNKFRSEALDSFKTVILVIGLVIGFYLNPVILDSDFHKNLDISSVLTCILAWGCSLIVSTLDSYFKFVKEGCIRELCTGILAGAFFANLILTAGIVHWHFSQ